MKVSELQGRLWFGDVLVSCIDTNMFTGEPLKEKLFVEHIVIWVRNEDQDGPRDIGDSNDYDVRLMDDNGEVSDIRCIKSLDKWKYSHCAFNRGAWSESKSEKKH